MDEIIRKALEEAYPRLVKNDFKMSQRLQWLVRAIRKGSDTMREEHVQELVSIIEKEDK